MGPGDVLEVVQHWNPTRHKRILRGKAPLEIQAKL